MKLAHLIPGIGPLASAGIGAAAGLLAPPEPEIPTAMDDWDREFEERTGSLPSFSRLALQQHVRREMFRSYNRLPATMPPEELDALAFAGRRRA